MTCPKCGHQMIDPQKINLTPEWGQWYCPPNQPYQGCGHSIFSVIAPQPNWRRIFREGAKE